MARTPRVRTGAATVPSTLPATLPATMPTTWRAPAGAVAATAGGRSATAVPTQRARRRAPSTPVPLGSLVTAPAPALVTCPRCAGASVTHVAMTLADGAAVTFVSCHTCEARGWYAADGASLGLDAVLAGASPG